MYYHDIITQKSWEELKTLNKKIKFILIGGWASYFYTKELKSKDIDILIDYSELGKLKENYEVTKNDRLKKYEARKEEIQIDIYLPHYSEIGIPVDILIDSSTSLEGFRVLKKDYSLEKQFNYFLNFLDERTEAREIGLNKHLYKKLKTEIKGLMV